MFKDDIRHLRFSDIVYDNIIRNTNSLRHRNKIRYVMELKIEYLNGKKFETLEYFQFIRMRKLNKKQFDFMGHDNTLASLFILKLLKSTQSW